jgi:hypothetical protein
MLYKAYHDFEEQNIFDAKLEELYREGRRYVCLFPGVGVFVRSI